jgi:hypothetical protein
LLVFLWTHLGRWHASAIKLAASEKHVDFIKNAR